MRTVTFRRLSIEQWGHVFNMAGVSLGLVSAVTVMVQLHMHNKITKAENAQKLVELAMVSQMESIKDPKLAALWAEGNKNCGPPREEDRERFKVMWMVYLNILESAFHQREDGLIDEEDFQSRNRCLVVNAGAASGVWPELSAFYAPRFQRHVAGILAAHRVCRDPGPRP